MKIIQNQVCQGDMMVMRVDPASIPKDAKIIPAEGGQHILAWSETGHHHVVMERPGLQRFSGMDQLKSFLVVPEGEPLEIKHLRKEHTHDSIWLTPGTYAVVRQREFDITDGWRMAAD